MDFFRSGLKGRRTITRRGDRHVRKARMLRHENLESRQLMAADLVSSGRGNSQPLFDATWFQRLTVDASQATDQSPLSEQVHWKGQSVEVVPNEWIVQFRDDSGVSTASQAKQLFAQNDTGIEVVGGLGGKGQMLVRTPGMTFNGALATLRQWSSIDYVEPNMLNSAQRNPNDPGFPFQGGLRNDIDQDIDADQAWDKTVGKKNMVAAVIDTGVDYKHPDLAANIWTNPGEIPGDRLDNDGNGFVDDVHGFDFVNWDSDPMDQLGHGTHVAGTIGAVGNNSQGVTGVSWNTSIMVIQIFGASGVTASTDRIVAAINYATMMRSDYGVNVRVTNNSWGGGGYSQAMYEAIVRSGEADILFVAAAGNSNSNNDFFAQYPASYPASNIISVAAVDSSGRYASFSNYGSTSVDIAAPGVSILSTRPGGTYGYDNGTSMAAPHVTGAALLAASINPELGVNSLKQIILSTAENLSDRSKPTLTAGRLNANSVVNKAQASVGEADRFGIWRPSGGLFFADTGVQGYNGETPVQFGLPGDVPVAGDWDGDGRDTIGIFRPNGGLFFLDVNKPGYSGEGAFQFGLPGDLPVAGDWNGDGIDDVGVFRPGSGQFFLDLGPRGFNGEAPFSFGLPGDLPIAGDWDGNGRDEVGVFRGGGRSFYLDSGPWGFNGEQPFQFTGPGNLPFAGDWDRDGRDNVGMFNSNGGWAVLDVGQRGYQGEPYFQFGLAGDYPVSGIWNTQVRVTAAAASSPGVSSNVSLFVFGQMTPTVISPKTSYSTDMQDVPSDIRIQQSMAGSCVNALSPSTSQAMLKNAHVQRMSMSDASVDFAIAELSQEWPGLLKKRSGSRL